MCEIDADHVLDELAEIAFAVPGEEGGLPVKVADKLRALPRRCDAPRAARQTSRRAGYCSK